MLANIIGSLVRFEALQPSLQSRTFSTGNGNFADFNLIGIVYRGSATLIFEHEQHPVEEGAVFCLPHKKEAKVIVPAGSQIWLIGYSTELSSLVIGADFDSDQLQLLMRQLIVSSCSKHDMESSFLPLLNLLALEIGLPKKRSRTIISSVLRISSLERSNPF